MMSVKAMIADGNSGIEGVGLGVLLEIGGTDTLGFVGVGSVSWVAVAVGEGEEAGGAEGDGFKAGV